MNPLQRFLLSFTLILSPLLITLSQTLEVSIDVVDPTCTSLANACATVSINGGSAPYEINWNLGGSGFESCGYGAGSHYVMIKDADGAEAIVPFTVNEPEQFIAGVTNIAAASCEGCSDGKFTIEFTGGTGPFVYMLEEEPHETSQQDVDITGAPAGICSILCYDSNGCASSASVIVPNL